MYYYVSHLFNAMAISSAVMGMDLMQIPIAIFVAVGIPVTRYPWSIRTDPSVILIDIFILKNICIIHCLMVKW